MKIRPKVFLKAAELIASGEHYSCTALVYSGANEEEKALFRSCYWEDSDGAIEYPCGTMGIPYWNLWPKFGDYDRRQARIIALLLAYEIAKGGGL